MSMNLLNNETVFIDSGIPTTTQISEKFHQVYSKEPAHVLNNFFRSVLGTSPEFEIETVAKTRRSCELKFHPYSLEPNALIVKVMGPLSGDIEKQCALEACRTLDMKGLLTEEMMNVDMLNQHDFNEDFSGSDEDEFYDRTSRPSELRQKRIVKKSKEKPQTEYLTFEVALKEFMTTKGRISELNEKLDNSRKITDSCMQNAENGSQLDSLDAFMNSIKGGALTSKAKQNIKAEIQTLKAELVKKTKTVERLRPTEITEEKLKALMNTELKVLADSKKIVEPKVTEIKKESVDQINPKNETNNPTEAKNENETTKNIENINKSKK